MVTRLLALLALLAASVCGAAQLAPHVRLEAQLEPPQVYVQAQAVYRLRLYQAIDVRELQLVAPVSRFADIRQMGEGRVYETQRDGRRYRVHERSYAVFPFASGELQLTGAHASVRVALPGLQSADGRQPLRIDAPAQTLTVLPAAGDGPWLPAQWLTLGEYWSDLPGGAQRRTLRIEAAGVDAAQLPELLFAADGITVHAEAARLENRFEGERNIGVREQSFIVAPAGSGAAVAPAVRLRWWNADAARAMTAALPPRTLRDVAAGQPLPPSAASAQPAPWGLLAAVLPFAMGLWLYCRRDELRLLRACRRGDARTVRDQLLQWGAAIWREAPPRTLSALAAHLQDPAARHAVAGFERQLYGPTRQAPDPQALHALVRLVRREIRRDARHRAAMMGARLKNRGTEDIKKRNGQ